MPQATPRARPVTQIASQLPQSYFHQTQDAFGRACDIAGCSREFFLELAGLKICLKAAGDTLLPRITKTLAHLEIPPRKVVDFTICCWDDNAAGNALPMPTPWMAAQAPYSCLSILSDDRYRTFFIQWMQILTCVDLQANIAYCCYEDAKKLLMYEISGPLRPVFNLILNRRGMQMIHASAVGTPEASLLFAGAPRSGKSTLAILCLQEGLSYQSDDLCILSAEKRPRSFSLYNIAKLREDSFPRFKSLQPLLTPFQEDDGEQKAYFYVHQHFPRRVLKEAPVRALILPRISGENRSRLERAMPMDAVRAVISWTLGEIPKSDTLGQRIMLHSVSRLPAYHLHLGADDCQTVALIRSVLNDS